MSRKITFAEAINEALNSLVNKNKKVIIMGLGVDDPKGIFGTTLNINKKFPKNVVDLPTSENSFTGFALGLSISNFIPILVHQRVEFSLLSLEQIFNQIAKWRYMSGGTKKCHMVIRLIVGKGWGQGPQHAQSLETIFSHIPGLKVVCPSNPEDAKGMLISSAFDGNPVIFFEHRWLHSIESDVNKKFYKKNIHKSKLIRKGKDITLISYSYSVVECLKAADYLKKFNIFCDIVDLRVLRPLDDSQFIKSAKKTGKVLVVDNGMVQYGISSEVISRISEKISKKIKVRRIGVIDAPIPSSKHLAKYCYPEMQEIIISIKKLMNLKKIKIPKKRDNSDQPDISFTGPF